MAEQDPQNTPEQPEGAAPDPSPENATPDDVSDAVERSERAAESLAEDAKKGDAPEDVNDAAADALKAAQAAIAAAKGQQAGKAAASPKGSSGAAQPNVAELAAEAVALPDFNNGSGHANGALNGASRDIDLLADVNLNVTIELGRTRMLVEDVLRLGEGSVVELDKLAGDPVDVFVNGRHVARGEVLVVNDNFCVRVSEILSRTPGSDD